MPWQHEPAEDSHDKIENRASGPVLGIDGASRSAGASALQWGDSLTADHLGRLVPSGPDLKIVNRLSGLVLGVQDASTASNVRVLQWNDTGTRDHLWTVVR